MCRGESSAQASTPNTGVQHNLFVPFVWLSVAQANSQDIMEKEVRY